MDYPDAEWRDVAPPIVVKEEIDYDSADFELVWTLPKFSLLYKCSETQWSKGITMRELGINAIEGRWRIYMDLTRDISFSLRFTDTDEQSQFYTGKCSAYVFCVLRLTTGLAGDESIVRMTECGWKKVFMGEKNSRYDFLDTVSVAELLGNEDSDTGELTGNIQDNCIHVSMKASLLCLNNNRSNRKISGGARSQQMTSAFAERQLAWLRTEDSKKPTDFILCSGDGKEFHVHRSLLDTHSPVFAAMTFHDTKEKQLSRCSLEEEDGESVGMLVDYLYTGEMSKIDENNAEKMLSLADKYQLTNTEMRQLCEIKLVRTVNEETAVPLMIFANQRNLKFLLRAALKMIPHSMGEIMSNKELVDAMNRDPEQMKTVMDKCAERTKINADRQDLLNTPGSTPSVHTDD